MPALGKGTANFINRSFIGYGAESQYIGTFTLAKGFEDMVVNHRTVFVRDINIDLKVPSVSRYLSTGIDYIFTHAITRCG